MCQNRGIGPFEFDSEESSKIIAPNACAELSYEDLESKAPKFQMLKSRQERVAAAKGRTFGLLVNLKV
ncbi:MAG: hypothetical protein EA369_00085 [Bradymonadales bacterium]|nr:MAG: hypothetical protein EA369_00085 [Bradymonadales bacterium]